MADEQKLGIDWSDPRARLNAIVAAMWAEYEADDQCDRRRMNRLLEEAADIVSAEIGGNDQLEKLADAFNGC